jgi:hypothetical protein
VYIKILTLFLCLFSFFGYAHEREIDEILKEPNAFENSAHQSSFSSAITAAHVPNEPTATIHKKEEPVLKNAKILAKKIRAKAETSAVSIIKKGGYSFHVADYPDGTRVVTCLDGSGKGYQGIAVNGVAIDESNDVKWYSKYHFIHKYPSGQIKSYKNKQIMEIY